MRQKNQDTGTPKAGTPETSGDGVLKDLAAKAAVLAPTLTTGSSADPRRRGEIEIDGDSDRYLLLIDGELWAELDWSYWQKKWCIQDCMGQCLSHVEHVHAEVGDGSNEEYEDLAPEAIELAKKMIRDGSMPSPEEAREAYAEREKKLRESLK